MRGGELGGLERALASVPALLSVGIFFPGSAQAPSPCFLVSNLQTLTHPFPNQLSPCGSPGDGETQAPSVLAQQLKQGSGVQGRGGLGGLGPKPRSRDAAELQGAGASLVGGGRQELRRGRRETTTEGPAGGRGSPKERRPHSSQTTANATFHTIRATHRPRRVPGAAAAEGVPRKSRSP